jgi:diguanylate cyclase (GGDEF)-like protein
VASNVDFGQTTRVITLPEQQLTLGAALWRWLRTSLSAVWSTTQFDNAEVTDYAEKMMLAETRRGLMLMAALSFFTQAAALFLHTRLGIPSGFDYIYVLLALLSLHIVVSSKFVADMRALHMLGTLLLVVTAMAIMTIAHRSGTINAGLMTSIVLLFMVMPLMPWGLREAATIVGVTYLMLTLSSLSVEGRFAAETLWTLQFLLLASATVATLVVMRNTAVRRDDIRARYELENTQRKLQLLSVRDPLTGAWNRRYLKKNFKSIARGARIAGHTLQLALLDVDMFKNLNDNHGHHHGDKILQRLTETLVANLSGTAHVIRLGGDEFAVLDTAADFPVALQRCLTHLETDPKLLDVGGEPVRVSAGLAVIRPGDPADLDRMYRAADEALYAEKGARKQVPAP